MRRIARITTVLGLLLILPLTTAASVTAGPIGRPLAAGTARFEGRWVDLARSWEGARACVLLPGHPTSCFRSQAAADAAVARMLPDVSCSTPLRLYDGTFLTGTSVSVYTRGLWIDLSSLGFDNKTSSYKVGACSVEIAAMSQGGGARYPICLNAGCEEDTMISGWDNVPSSVYLH